MEAWHLIVFAREVQSLGDARWTSRTAGFPWREVAFQSILRAPTIARRGFQVCCRVAEGVAGEAGLAGGGGAGAFGGGGGGGARARRFEISMRSTSIR
jgi:hypothetical protein